ncbi:hypothetical protein ABZ281_28090 [Streptomyces sp. NPDC006265]|uniref:hypothetical protein n=1 Tax=Streptomyces sp. NPDC006265 TaxID=3156740 RepID=UPI0033BBC453
MDNEVAAYLNAVRQAPTRLIEPYLTSVCTECDRHVNPSDPDGHVMVGYNVVIGCEGYWLIDPTVVGIWRPNWHDWRKTVVSTPETLYARGEALAKFAESLGLVDPSFSRTGLGGMFAEEKLVGAATAALRAWLESRRGPIAVRAADKEAMYFTEDESFIGQVPLFTYGGITLSVGDEVTGTNRASNGEERVFRGVVKEIGPTYWGSELCPTGLVVEGPDVPQDGSWDWHDLKKVTES